MSLSELFRIVVNLGAENETLLPFSSQKELLEARKLILLVDLDNTVLHAVDNKHFKQDDLKDVPDIHQGKQTTNRWVKLRPDALGFLDKMSNMFEMHIVTMSSKSYATNMAKILDPTGTIFGSRIVARDDMVAAKSKNKAEHMKKMFPEGTEMVLIIDDRCDVWENSQRLLKVKPYRFFLKKVDSNNVISYSLKTPSKLAVDNELQKAERTLQSLHERYFKKHDEQPADAPVFDLMTILLDDRMGWIRLAMQKFEDGSAGDKSFDHIFTSTVNGPPPLT